MTTQFGEWQYSNTPGIVNPEVEIISLSSVEAEIISLSSVEAEIISLSVIGKLYAWHTECWYVAKILRLINYFVIVRWIWTVFPVSTIYCKWQNLCGRKIFAVHWILSWYRNNCCSFAFDKNENKFLCLLVRINKEYILNQVYAGCRSIHAWFLEIAIIFDTSVCVYVCACVCLPQG